MERHDSRGVGLWHGDDLVGHDGQLLPPPPGRGAPPLLITTGDGKIRLNPCDSGTKHKRDNNEQDAEVVDLLYANDT